MYSKTLYNLTNTYRVIQSQATSTQVTKQKNVK